MPRRLEFTWSTRRDGNDGWVLEECGELWRREFGPFPPHAVEAWVTGRRRYVAMLMRRLGADYVLEDPEQFFRDATSPETRHAARTNPPKTH